MIYVVEIVRKIEIYVNIDECWKRFFILYFDLCYVCRVCIINWYCFILIYNIER